MRELYDSSWLQRAGVGSRLTRSGSLGGLVRYRVTVSRSVLIAALCFGFPASAAAQTTPSAPAQKPPDDTPSIRIGATIFLDYTVTQKPKAIDADGNEITPNQFNVQRAYLNVTGQISHIVAFRVTPDIARETGTGSSLSGSYTYRLKYAYAQFNLDDWMQRGTYARFGMQPTPWIGFIDDVYRYRFQGPTLEDREGILSSSDFGASFRYSFPGSYGDVHGGFYNGDNYNRLELSDQKAVMVRVSVRPLPSNPLLRGFRVSGFYDHDAYVQNAERRRGIIGATYEHPLVNVGGNYLTTKDQMRATATEVNGEGFTVWATPKTRRGWEGLLRLDYLKPDDDRDGSRKRSIFGVAYWFPGQGSATAALLFDVETVDNDGFVSGGVDERRFAVHMLVNF
jgi:hypothetical protein